MDKRQEYLYLHDRQRKELTDFPIAYAFNEKQLEEALAKLGAKKEECVSYLGIGDVMKKSDVPAFLAMCERHTKEMHDALKEDEAFAEAAFLYEMDNHEYAINWSGDEDVLDCFRMKKEHLREWGLETAYRRARNKHMRHAEELGVI